MESTEKKRGKTRTSIDMLHGPLLGKIFQFAVPVALSGLLQQMFNAADTAVVGQFAASGALAAVSGNSFVINLMVGLFIGISIGTNVQMAACNGTGNREGLVKALHTSVTFSFLCGLVLTVIGWFVAPVAHGLLGTGTEMAADGTVSTNAFVLEQAIVYFRIYFLSMPFMMLYNFASAIFRSKGDTQRPLYVLTISGILNVFLNLFFVKVVGLNAEGVAIATALSNVFGCGALVFLLLREEGDYHLDFRKLGIDGRTLVQIIRIGLPAGIQSSMFSIANVILQSSINALGTEAVAATGVGIYAEYFGMNMIIGFSQAATAFIGQNYAAGNGERCRKIARISLISGTIATLAMTSLINLFSTPFISIFLDTSRPENQEIARIAAIRIAQVGMFQFLNGISEICSGCMRGMRRSLVPALISVITICGVRLLWILFLHSPEQGYGHLIISFRLSWGISALCMSIAYLIISRKALKPQS